jgi:hypothetical protein
VGEVAEDTIMFDNRSAIDDRMPTNPRRRVDYDLCQDHRALADLDIRPDLRARMHDTGKSPASFRSLLREPSPRFVISDRNHGQPFFACPPAPMTRRLLLQS